MRTLLALLLLGSLASVSCRPEVPARVFEPGDDFEPMPEVKSGDWLEIHPEKGQTFERFVRSRPNRPDARRNKIYLQPLGTFGPNSPPLEQLRQLTAAFFALTAEVLPPLSLEAHRITSRQNPFTKNRQFLTGDLLGLLERQLPDDAFAVLGVTMEDLYPGPDWNFVFGQASLRDRVGVYSFARFDPFFYGETRPADWRRLMLRRSCKVLAHETGHMFGIHHCTFYRCLMNGSNSLEETDSQPLHLCPVDLRKLHDSIGFEVVERARRLLEFSESVGFEDEARWLRQRIEFVSGGD